MAQWSFVPGSYCPWLPMRVAKDSRSPAGSSAISASISRTFSLVRSSEVPTGRSTWMVKVSAASPGNRMNGMWTLPYHSTAASRTWKSRITPQRSRRTPPISLAKPRRRGPNQPRAARALAPMRRRLPARCAGRATTSSSSESSMARVITRGTTATN